MCLVLNQGVYILDLVEIDYVALSDSLNIYHTCYGKISSQSKMNRVIDTLKLM